MSNMCSIYKTPCQSRLGTADYEEKRILGYKYPVRTSQETHYVSATEPGRLMLGRICGFHGGDCEELCILGYKYPVRTSQETHHVSVTEPGRLMLCKIWHFRGNDYEECHLNSVLQLLVTTNVVSNSLIPLLREMHGVKSKKKPFFVETTTFWETGSISLFMWGEGDVLIWVH
jgi:hypothetical protein